MNRQADKLSRARTKRMAEVDAEDSAVPTELLSEPPPEEESAFDVYQETIRTNAIWKEYEVKKPRVPIDGGEQSFQTKYRPNEVTR
jgi:hypothetical protein